MSMVSHAAGARFYSLLRGAMLSFYDWDADLPVASGRGARMRISAARRTENENRIRAAMDRLLRGEIP